MPDWQLGSVSDFIFASTEIPAVSTTPGAPNQPTQTPAPTPTIRPGADATIAPGATQVPNLEYIPATDGTDTPTPVPSATHTPTPVPTADPGGMTVEEEE